MTSAISPLRTAAVLVNGHMNYSESIANRINQFSTVILVDGGANHFYSLSKKFCMKMPQLITGDLDSINPKVNSYYRSLNVQFNKLDRAKDKTDLEEALDSLNVSQYEETVIFGGLGGRLDHTLGNLFLLLRYPSNKLFFETESERVFVINSEQQKDYIIDRKGFTFCSFYSFYEPPHKVTFNDGQNSHFYESLTLQGAHCKLSGNSHFLSVSIEKGQLLCIQNYGNETLDSSLIKTFSLLNEAFNTKKVLSERNKSYKIIESFETYTFDSKIGETISLVPLLGSAKEITTKGLKWELHRGSLHKDFIGISNIALQENCTITLEEGSLICIINHDLIDEEMIFLKDHSSTARLTQESDKV